MEIQISQITPDDLTSILAAAQDFWGASTVVVHGELYDLTRLPGFKVVVSGQLAGFLHYQIRDSACEILTLASLREGKGIGSALLQQLENFARGKGVRLIHLVTTNDNLHALGFYQRRGYHLAAVYPGQVEISRKLKPAIPMIGDNEIPIRDEIRLEKEL